MPTVLITGASTGIGLDFCHIFAEKGNDLILVARSKSKLEEVAKELSNKYKIKTWVCASDLSKPESPEQIYNYTKFNNLSVDILVNNAGFGTNGKFIGIDLKEEQNLVLVNIFALLTLTRLFAKDMADKKSGKILNVASCAGFQPGPFMSNYYASKAYVISLSEGIHEELKETGVVVSTLCPGPTRTPFFERAGMHSGSLFLRSPAMMDSRTVAEIGYRGLMKGKAIVIPGILNSIMAQSVRFSPRFLVRKIAGKINSSG